MEKARTIFLALSDPLRLRALALVAARGELCVCEVVAALDAPQPKVSRHLAVLRDAGVCVARREAQWLHYRIAPDLEGWPHDAVTAAVRAAQADPQHAADLERLQARGPQVRRVTRAATTPEDTV